MNLVGLQEVDWVCVRTEPQREDWAEANLTRTGLDVYCPRQERWISHARRRQLVARPLFPNYLFARSAHGLDAMGHVKRTPGVSSLAGRDLASSTVTDGVIAALRARETAAGFIDLAPALCAPGTKIKITAGPFNGIEAIFREPRDDRRALILLSMLGKQHSVVVHTSLLECAG